MYAAVSAAYFHESVGKFYIYRSKSKNAYQIVKLDGGDTSINTRDDLLSDSNGVDMVGVKSVTQTRYTSSDFVELDTLLAAICLLFSGWPDRRGRLWKNIPRFFTYIVTGV
jgi:hypothetical protein